MISRTRRNARRNDPFKGEARQTRARAALSVIAVLHRQEAPCRTPGPRVNDKAF